MLSGDTALRKESDHVLRAWNGKIKRHILAELEPKQNNDATEMGGLCPQIDVHSWLLWCWQRFCLSWLFCCLVGFLAINGPRKEKWMPELVPSGEVWGTGLPQGMVGCACFLQHWAVASVLAQAQSRWGGNGSWRFMFRDLTPETDSDTVNLSCRQFTGPSRLFLVLCSLSCLCYPVLSLCSFLRHY